MFPRWWGERPAIETTASCKAPGACIECHETKKMDPSHAFSCVKCHRGDPEASGREQAHKGLIKDPGDLASVSDTCGSCHPDEAHRVKRSPMALATRMIAHTRFAFGAAKSVKPEFGAVHIDSVKTIPTRAQSSSLGDDLLRRSCLRCHLNVKGSSRWGEHRGVGCSACHAAFPNSEDGKPQVHAIFRRVGVTACLKCHNSNHVGADYVGLFEKDFNRGFKSPFKDGKLPPRIYGSEQHRLVADTHFAAGMDCMDCHLLEEIHGTGNVPASPGDNVTISCEGCHVTGEHPAVLKTEDGKLSLLGRKTRSIPKWDPSVVQHSVPEHRNKIKCSACHAAWGFQDYGLSLMLEDRADYWKWAPTAAQNDPQIQELLDKYVGTYVEPLEPRTGALPYTPPDKWKPPATKDWLTGESQPGAWFRGFTARRWERPPLGVDSSGRVSVMRPMYQYVVSHVDKDDNLLMDRKIPTMGSGEPALVFNPYSPHTTSKQGRSCQECHGDFKAIGLGEGLPGVGKSPFLPIWRPEKKIPGASFRWDALVDPSGKPVQFSTHPGAGPLPPEVIGALTKPSQRHRALWNRSLQRQ